MSALKILMYHAVGGAGEAGTQVITSLLGAGLVDRIVVGTAPRIIGAGTEAVGDLGVARVTDGIVLRNRSVHLTSDDVVTADHEPVDAMRSGEDEPGDQVVRAAEREPVRPPHREVGRASCRERVY